MDVHDDVQKEMMVETIVMVAFGVVCVGAVVVICWHVLRRGG